MTTKTNPLLDAADYITENGWCRNSYFNEKGQVCLAGAVGIVTGAFVPVPEAKRETLIKKYAKQYGCSEKQAVEDVEFYTRSRSKPKLRAYNQAIRVLAETIDAEKVAQVEAYRVSLRSQPWFQSMSEQEQVEHVERHLTAQTEGVVTSHNDGSDRTPKGRKYRTTKAQALKLLRKAAERY